MSQPRQLEMAVTALQWDLFPGAASRMNVCCALYARCMRRHTCLAVLVAVASFDGLDVLKAAKRLPPDGVLAVKEGVPSVPGGAQRQR